MGDHDDGGPVRVQLGQQLQDAGPGGAVQVAGRLVGEDDGRPAHDGPGDRDALALAAGQLGWPVPEPVTEPDALQRVDRRAAALGGRDAPVQQAVRHVLHHPVVLEQEELLEHESQAAGPPGGQLPVGQPGGVLAGHLDDPGGGPLQRPGDVQQRGLPRAGRPGDGDPLGGPQGQVHVVQRRHRRLPRIGLGDVVKLEDGHDEGTSTRIPARNPGPLTWTSVSANSPVVTPSRVRCDPLTTSTP